MERFPTIISGFRGCCLKKVTLIGVVSISCCQRKGPMRSLCTLKWSYDVSDCVLETTLYFLKDIIPPDVSVIKRI